MSAASFVELLPSSTTFKLFGVSIEFVGAILRFDTNVLLHDPQNLASMLFLNRHNLHVIIDGTGGGGAFITVCGTFGGTIIVGDCAGDVMFVL